MKIEGRHATWSVTINNPTVSDYENLNLARQKGWKCEGQQEVGENGTPHLQLMVRSGQQRFSALKKQFPRAHIEVCRDETALKKYVHKEDTKVADLPVTDELYPSQAKMWDMFSWWLTETYEPKSEAISSLISTWDDERWLVEFDKFCNLWIADGYVLEGIAVNPQVRSGLKKFGYSIYIRSVLRKYGGYIRRQTDRQTDEYFVVGSSINEQDAFSTSGCEITEEEEGYNEAGLGTGSETGSFQADSEED